MNIETNKHGYQSFLYAFSLSEFGSPLFLSKSEGWLLTDKISDFDYYDARGCYPIFSCPKWGYFIDDLKEIQNKYVSIYMVLDPFGDYNIEKIKEYFDICFPFKHHFVINFKKKLSISKHHLRNIKKALRKVEVKLVQNLLDYLEEWSVLYSYLIQRHNIEGIAKFSFNSFKKLFEVPGIYMFIASNEGRTVGINIWFLQGHVAYYHLGAYSRDGYRLGASFALFSFAIDFFKNIGVSFLNLGGAAGIKKNSGDGLKRFKQGWANEKKVAYFCGKICNVHIYNKLVKLLGRRKDFFPEYRKRD